MLTHNSVSSRLLYDCSVQFMNVFLLLILKGIRANNEVLSVFQPCEQFFSQGDEPCSTSLPIPLAVLQTTLLL